MKDLHCHLLPGVDDGSKSFESTKEMLDRAKENGITDIMLTPHYVKDSKYISNQKKNKEIFKDVKKYANEIGLNVYLGNEVYINHHLIELYEAKEISTLNDSKYMLVELPMTTRYPDAKSIFFDLINHGITPILAHPERYIKYYKDLDFFIDLRIKGVLMQINYPSIVGIYGRKAKKMAKLLLKSNVISFVGSDNHSITEGKYEAIPKALKKLKKIVGEEKMLELTEKNFIKIINNEDI